MMNIKFKNFLYYGFFFLFFALCLNCSPMDMEELSSSEDEGNSPGLHQQTDGGTILPLQEEAINSTGGIQQLLSDEDLNAIKLIVHTSKQKSQTLTSARMWTTGVLVIFSLVTAYMVMGPFGIFGMYLLLNGVPPTHDGTCVFNGTYPNGTHSELVSFAPPNTLNSLNFQAQNTTIDYGVLETIAAGIIPATACITAAVHGGGDWVVDTSRRIEQKYRRYWWSGAESKDDASEEEQSSISHDEEEEDEEAGSCCPRLKSCLPKHSLSSWVYSPATKFINGFYWSWYLGNFTATTFIENYRRMGNLKLGITWACIFTPPSIPFTFHLFTHLTGEANKHPLHYRLSNNQGRSRVLVMAVQETMETTQISPVMIALAKIMNESNTITSDSEKEQAWIKAVAELDRELIKQIENDEQTRSQYARYSSFLLQGFGFPSKVFGQFALLNKPLALICLMALGATPTAENIAFYSALIPTLLLTPHLAFGSLRELSVIQYILYNFLGGVSYIRHQLPACRLPSLYQLKNSTALVAAGALNIIYMETSTWFSGERDLMCNQFTGKFRILNDQARGVLPGFLCCGTPGFVFWYFLDRQFRRISDAMMASKCCSPSIVPSDTLTAAEKKELRWNLQKLIHDLTIDQQHIPNTQKKRSEISTLI